MNAPSRLRISATRAAMRPGTYSRSAAARNHRGGRPDARNLRYLFVNKAAEEMIGMSRAEIMGKTPRELFPESAAELIERRDRQLLERKQQLEAIVDTVDNPVKGRRTIAVRRLQIGGPERKSHLFVSMVEDRTDQTDVAAPTEAAE
ncbi:PAS domain-containing protein [Bradyrhizobium sp. sGM-13]|uniref:PAS domain-containing protein n=1 Tax=Bradyrhizobium sp. sGM-13 TaxID=2831781 RepID=UPI0035C7BFEF